RLRTACEGRRIQERGPYRPGLDGIRPRDLQRDGPRCRRTFRGDRRDPNPRGRPRPRGRRTPSPLVAGGLPGECPRPSDRVARKRTARPGPAQRAGEFSFPRSRRDPTHVSHRARGGGDPSAFPREADRAGGLQTRPPSGCRPRARLPRPARTAFRLPYDPRRQPDGLFPEGPPRRVPGTLRARPAAARRDRADGGGRRDARRRAGRALRGRHDAAGRGLPTAGGALYEHMLDLRVILEAARGEVLPEPALLVAAVGHLAHDRQVVVDLDGPEAEGVRHAVRALHVLRPHGRIEAVDDVVGRVDRLLLIRELLDIHHGSEHFLPRDPHGGIGVHEGRRFVEPTLVERLALRTLAAEGELRAFVVADLDVVLDLVPLLRRNQGAEVRRPLERIAHPDGLEPLEELLLELLVGLVVDDE